MPDRRLIAVGSGGGDGAPADPAEDVRGRKVCDARGETIGDVDDLLVDEEHRKVRLLRVTAGGFLGMGRATYLIPVDAVTRVEDDAVHIDRSGIHVTSAPACRPGTLDEHYLKGLYAHYGHVPFWDPQHVPPTFPFCT